jgi:uncharacterized protein YjiS (DUF1127 family)
MLTHAIDANVSSGCAAQGVMARIAQWARRKWTARLTRLELSGLSDLELRDIGIARCDIDHVAASVTDWIEAARDAA